MLSERQRRFTFEHFSKIFLVLCNKSIDEETLCDYFDKITVLDTDSIMFEFSDLTVQTRA